MRVTGLRARYLHGAGRNTRMFHIINLDEVRSWETPGPEGWTVLTLYTACGTRWQLTSTATVLDRSVLTTDPPKGLKPCPRCFSRWEALGKPLTAEQWRDNIKVRRVMTGHANRAKARGNQK